VSGWSRGESILMSAGLEKFARVIRRARLSSTATTQLLRNAQLLQFEVNIPFLTVAGLALAKHAQRTGADTLLMCARDCSMWVDLMRWIAGFADGRLAVHYFASSRDLFTEDNVAYVGYFNRVRGNRTLVADLSGTGRTPMHFIAHAGGQKDTGVYIALKSDWVSPDMDLRAPARDDVEIDLLIQDDDGLRFLFEKFNTATEGQALHSMFTGHQFHVLRRPQIIDDRSATIVDVMKNAFSDALALFQKSALTGTLAEYDDDRLRKAARDLADMAGHYADVVQGLPDD
jgi:hypothetical protein